MSDSKEVCMFLDFMPIVAFFLSYQLYDIYVATASAMVCVLGQMLWQYSRERRLSETQWMSLILITLLGGATLIFQNPWFIKWKPTVLYWLFSGLFMASIYVGKRDMARFLLDQQVCLEEHQWRFLNQLFSLFFA